MFCVVVAIAQLVSNSQGNFTGESINPLRNNYWYTHKGLHQAYTHIINALPHLFSYLNDPEIPSTTNRLEGFFKHLKEKLLLHSGLRLEAKRNFIKWYLHFKNTPLR